MPKTLLILGGYGNAGREIAKLLLKETDVSIIVAGRNLELAQEQADNLNTARGAGGGASDRVKPLRVDASSAESLQQAFHNVDMVVVASSTNAYAYDILDAALNADIDYYDINASAAANDAMESLQSRLESSMRCFVTEGGCHPGTPAALVRYAATQCSGSLQTANVYVLMAPNWTDLKLSDATREEFFQELNEMSNEIYMDGKWEKQGWSVTREYDFGEPFQTKTCVPMFLDELRDLPQEIPSLNNVGMYISGFDPVTTFCVMPVGMLAAVLCPTVATKPMANLFAWSLKKFASPPFGAVISLEAQEAPKEGAATTTTAAGERPTSRLRVTVSHEDGYVFTAVPAVACLLQLLEEGGAAKPGLHYQAQIVEPKRFVADLERMGLNVSIKRDTVDG